MRKINLLMITPENKRINLFRKNQLNNFMQLTMPYLAGFVDPGVYNIELIDEYNQKIPFHKKYDLVAITVNTPNAIHCYDISNQFKQAGSSIVLGGPHVTLQPEEAIKHSDFIVIGEAETLWPQFLSDFKNKSPKKIYYSNDCPDLKGLPLPRRDLVKSRLYTKGAVIATRGCQHYCKYCNLKQIYKPFFRKRPVIEVIDEINSIGSKYFVFWDDNFFSDIEYTKELLTALIKLNKNWAAQVTIDKCKDEELLQLAKESGCLYLFIGFESFSQDSLLSVNKSINQVEDYQSIISLIHKYNICVQAGIIFGFDTDRKDVFSNTLNACEKMGIDGATVSILTPLPKTEIYEQLSKERRIISSDWTDYDGKTSVAYIPKNMTPQELYDGYMWFRRNFYSMRSIYQRIKISRVRPLYNIAINMGYKFSIKNISIKKF